VVGNQLRVYSHCQLAAFDLQYKIVVQYGSLKGIKMPLAPFQVMRPQMQTLNYVTSKLRGLHMVLPACLGSPLYSELSLRCKWQGFASVQTDSFCKKTVLALRRSCRRQVALKSIEPVWRGESVDPKPWNRGLSLGIGGREYEIRIAFLHTPGAIVIKSFNFCSRNMLYIACYCSK